jgi:hypothetical protein
MTHADADHYAAKHPVNKTLNKIVAAAVQKRAAEGGINCADAAAIAENLKVTMPEVGVTIDLLEIRLKRCQLGLFGFGEQKLIIKPADQVAPDMEKAIRSSLIDGRLPCLSAWEIADGRGIARMDVSSACEKLKIKIKPCQLGAF